MIRTEAGMSTTRFCELIDMPERTWRRWQAKAGLSAFLCKGLTWHFDVRRCRVGQGT